MPAAHSRIVCHGEFGTFDTRLISFLVGYILRKVTYIYIYLLKQIFTRILCRYFEFLIDLNIFVLFFYTFLIDRSKFLSNFIRRNFFFIP